MLFEFLIVVVSAVSLVPSVALAQNARGNFTLARQVHWGNAVLPAGDYRHSLEDHSGYNIVTVWNSTGAPSSLMSPNSIRSLAPRQTGRLNLTRRGDDWFVEVSGPAGSGDSGSFLRAGAGQRTRPEGRRQQDDFPGEPVGGRTGRLQPAAPVFTRVRLWRNPDARRGTKHSASTFQRDLRTVTGSCAPRLNCATTRTSMRLLCAPGEPTWLRSWPRIWATRTWLE
jgi:hypothetical protein